MILLIIVGWILIGIIVGILFAKFGKETVSLSEFLLCGLFGLFAAIAILYYFLDVYGNKIILFDFSKRKK